MVPLTIDNPWPNFRTMPFFLTGICRPNFCEFLGTQVPISAPEQKVNLEQDSACSACINPDVSAQLSQLCRCAKIQLAHNAKTIRFHRLNTQK